MLADNGGYSEDRYCGELVRNMRCPTYYLPHDYRNYHTLQGSDYCERHEKPQITSCLIRATGCRWGAESRLVTSLTVICRSHLSRRVLTDREVGSVFPSWGKSGAQRRVDTGGTGHAGKVGCRVDTSSSTGDLLCILCIGI